jgi:hypothetical protein
MGGRFLKVRAVAKDDLRGAFDLKFGHLRRNPCRMRMIVYGNYFLQWRLTLKHGHRLRAQLRFRAQNRLQGKIGNKDAGERHGKRRWPSFAKSNFKISHGSTRIITDKNDL